MSRPYVVSIAGFDPSGGAGVLADIKTFEAHKVYGMGVCSAITFQNDTSFLGIEWLDVKEIIRQLEPIITKFAISAVKVGIIKNLQTLIEVIDYIENFHQGIKIVLDPVLKASAGFDFHGDLNVNEIIKVLKQVTLVTPNYNEMLSLENMLKNAPLKAYTNVLLKGGHNPEQEGTDILFFEGKVIEIPPKVKDITTKHGSGCVLSSAITSNLAIGHSLPQSCVLAKEYIEQFLNSNTTPLGYHNYDR